MGGRRGSYVKLPPFFREFPWLASLVITVSVSIQLKVFIKAAYIFWKMIAAMCIALH